MTKSYSLEVLPCDQIAGYFTWAIHENRRLFQSCDRPLPTQEMAERHGMAALNRMFVAASDPPRGHQ
jgi:hypothetical protein